MRLLIAAFAGGLFGLGLLVAGMTDTSRVQGFLDLFGAWDPTLIFVFVGALPPMFIAWRMSRGRATAALGSPLPAPTNVTIDRKLLLGSIMFGAGWGLVGLCPGPALASLTFGGTAGIVFAAAMIVGMVVARMSAAQKS